MIRTRLQVGFQEATQQALPGAISIEKGLEGCQGQADRCCCRRVTAVTGCRNFWLLEPWKNLSGYGPGLFFTIVLLPCRVQLLCLYCLYKAVRGNERVILNTAGLCLLTCFMHVKLCQRSLTGVSGVMTAYCSNSGTASRFFLQLSRCWQPRQ